MKKLIHIIVFLLLPLIIIAQEKTKLRTNRVNCNSTDSISKKLLPLAEKWRLDYNKHGANQISPFDSYNTGNFLSADDAYIGYRHFAYSANFQKETGYNVSVDSVLVLFINPSCDQAFMYSLQMGKAGKQKNNFPRIITWHKKDGVWKAQSHLEAIKE
jgi:hypothetical protein